MRDVLTPCPDLEVLAALVDRGLGGFERKAAVAHLLGCADCRTLVAYVLRTQDGVSGAPRGSGGRAAVPGRYRKVDIPRMG